MGSGQGSNTHVNQLTTQKDDADVMADEEIEVLNSHDKMAGNGF